MSSSQWLDGGEPILTAHGADTLGGVLQRAAARFSRHGFTFADPREEATSFLSYPDLALRAARIAGGLRARGVRPGTNVLLQLADNEEIVSAFWGAIVAGAVPLVAPVPPVYDSINQVLERLRHVEELLGRPAVITSEAMLAPVRVFFNELTVYALGELTDGPAAGPMYRADPNEVAFYLMSSGSGGKVKCVPLTHRNVISNNGGANLAGGHRPQDIALNWLPLDHSGAFCDWHLRSVALGANLVLIPKEAILPDPLRWLDSLERFRAAASWAPNFAYAAIAQRLAELPDRRWDLSSVRFLLSAAEPIAGDAVRNFSERLRSSRLAPYAIRGGYGMTECSAAVVYTRPRPGEPMGFRRVRAGTLSEAPQSVDAGEPNAILLADLGGAIAGARLRVVDSAGRELPAGRVGQVQIAGPMVFPGYLGDAQADAEAFSADGWLQTGDMGFIENGSLFLTGRLKAILIVNGMKYFANEIESAAERAGGVLAGSVAACTVRAGSTAHGAVAGSTAHGAVAGSAAHGAVAGSAAHGAVAGSAARGTVEELALFLTPLDPAGDERALLSAVQERVTREIGVCPDALVAVEPHELPRTEVGKLIRGELVRRFEAGAFAGRVVRPRDLPAGDAARAVDDPNPVKALLGHLWSDLLGRADIAVADDFFRLGGNSLLALRLLGRLQEAFRVRLGMAAVFAAPTLTQLAELLVEKERQPGEAARVSRLLLGMLQEASPAEAH